jgi:hypothetical protein
VEDAIDYDTCYTIENDLKRSWVVVTRKRERERERERGERERSFVEI